MASLLSLPREVRDDIIDYIVASRRDPPIAQHGEASDGDNRVQLDDTHWKDVGNLVYFERSPLAFRPACGGLLLANRQLREETLERASKVDIPYVLDFLIVGEQKIWVTWLALPAQKSPMIEKLEIHVRFERRGREQTHETNETDAFILLFGTQFKNFLYRILAVGCAGPLPGGDRRLLWTEARYRFKDTSRFEYEYIPRYSIRTLEVFLPPYDRDNDPYVSLIKTYWTELIAVFYECVEANAMFENRKHPGWHLLRDRIGHILLCDDALDYRHWSDLSQFYERLANKYPPLADSIRRILATREANGL